MFITIKKIFTDPALFAKLSFLIFGLILFRILAAVPVPGVDTGVLGALLQENQLLSVFNIFSGGGLANFSIVLVGIFPYITVAIILQLLTVAVPKIHALYHEEGEIGRRKIAQWTRVATVPVALINSAGILFYFTSQGILPDISTFEFVTNIIIITAGTMLLMWIGELISEFGIGNGISFIVFAGIITSVPPLIQTVSLNFSPDVIPQFIVGAVGLTVLLAIVIWMNEADRPVPPYLCAVCYKL